MVEHSAQEPAEEQYEPTPQEEDVQVAANSRQKPESDLRPYAPNAHKRPIQG